jgi:Lon protease-like protein
MEQNPYAPDFNALPGTLPVFPLPGVLLLPSGNLPLNIFEKRYLKMVEDALGGNRMIGMIQPKGDDGVLLYNVGCAGKITEFRETDDGRYRITLTGISRFKIDEEVKTNTPYRQVRAGWHHTNMISNLRPASISTAKNLKTCYRLIFHRRIWNATGRLWRRRLIAASSPAWPWSVPSMPRKSRPCLRHLAAKPAPGLS